MNSVGGEADPLQCRVRPLVLEPTRPAQPGSEKRGSADATQSIAGSKGRACASGTLGVKFGMGDCMKPNVNWTTESYPYLQFNTTKIQKFLFIFNGLSGCQVV